MVNMLYVIIIPELFMSFCITYDNHITQYHGFVTICDIMLILILSLEIRK